MFRIFKYFVALIVIPFLFCAHKGPPLRIDRIDPRLKKITPINEHQIFLYFSEELDTLSIKSENFTIYTEQDTLKIISVTPGNTPDQISIYTQKMTKTEYFIEGRVYDLSKRTGVFKTKFIGSTKPDTISPVIYSYSKGFKIKNFYIEFSEPVDTTAIIFYVFPKRKMAKDWYYMKKLYLKPENDSLNYDTTYYLFLKGIKDLSGNPGTPFVTTITPDTIYNPIFIRGRAVLNDTLLIRGIALIGYEKILGISMIERGEFLFEVRDSLKYLIQVFGEGCYGVDSVSASDTNIIRVAPGVFNLDSIIN
ncbi:MAG: Ig-like domain-containing protein [candidate division WOR-3 bacterium]